MGRVIVGIPSAYDRRLGEGLVCRLMYAWATFYGIPIGLDLAGKDLPIRKLTLMCHSHNEGHCSLGRRR